ncbi:permease prefix domain 1-containing protein [uncultured Paracoccus sp.]|uniref:permease prefix domain 1-containing protein n=1 Tax=uncultured Paracoccus sp. TaxID=189685 RepID=UPI0025F16DC9|nr:permease prefix domain 1-containing protein [uncultured Paracoccus sp.]
MPDPLPELRERLLRAGVRPGAVSRYLAELRDHHDDLVAEALSDGLSEADATTRARQRLGGIDALARPIETDRRFHGWAGRTPWAVFVLIPVLVHAAAVVSVVLGLIAAARSGHAPGRLAPLLDAAQYLAGGVIPILGAWLLAVIAMRQRSRLVWPLAGAGVLALLSASVRLSLTAPVSGQPGEIAAGLALPSILHVLALILIAMLPVLWLPATLCRRFLAAGGR